VKTTPLQRILLAAAAALAIALAATFRRVPRPPREAPPPAASTEGPAGVGQPTTLLSGFDYSESTAGRTRFSVHADRTVGFAAGAGLPSDWYRLERVVLTLSSARGEPLTVRSDAADYDPRTRALHLKGSVTAHDARGTEVRAALVEFDPARDLLTIPGAIELSRGAITGHAASGAYSTTSRVLTLAGPVTAAGAPGAPFDSLAADSAQYRADDSVLTFSGSVRAARPGDTIACDALAVKLTPDSRVESATASGNASGTFASADSRGAWTASKAVSRFAEGKVAGIDLAGRPSTVTAPANAGQPERRLAAPAISLGFRGGRVVSADARGRARLERTVAGPSGSPFTESVVGDTARALFAGDGALASARVDGNVVGTTVQGSSKSPSASYSAATGVTSLFGAAGHDAELVAARGRIVGTRIDLDEWRRVVTATGDARAILVPGAANGATPAFVSSSGKPTRARADRIVLDDRARTAELSGGAALWQDDDAVLADRIELHDADRTARAQGTVRATGRSAAAGAKEDGRVTVSAKTMRWTDASRIAEFEGDVRAARGTQTARGDRGQCRVDAAGRIERTVLEGDVTFEDRATGRRGTGSRAVDDPKAGVTNLAGDPAVAQDAQGSRVQGAVLTFRKESGSVEVKAKEGGRVESVYQTHGR